MRIKFNFLYLPLIGIVIGVLYAFHINSGLAVTWQCIGKPSSNISKIVGFVGNKLFLITDEGDVYSIIYQEYLIAGKDSIPIPAQWVKEEKIIIVSDPIRPGYSGFIALPPLFKVKQEYAMAFPELEGSSLVKFVLSEDGNLWMWNFGSGGLAIFVYCIAPIYGGFVGGILGLITKFVIFLIKRS